MVELTSGRLRWVPAAASARQPEAVVSVIAALSIEVFGPSAGVRASISIRCPISILIATHLQLHLAITKMIPALKYPSPGEVAAGADALIGPTNALAQPKPELPADGAGPIGRKNCRHHSKRHASRPARRAAA